MKYSEAIASADAKIGVVYSKSDEPDYTIQIVENGTASVLTGWRAQPARFECLESAKSALRKHHVQYAYLALDNTYDEFGDFAQEDHQSNSDSRHDYMPLPLK